VAVLLAANSAWIGVAGALGGVVITGVIGLVTALLNHRWQGDERKEEHSARLQESRAALRRETYSRFLVASDQLVDLVLTQTPGESVDLTDNEEMRTRIRKLRLEGDAHFIQYNTALLEGQLIAGEKVAVALTAFEEWMTLQVVIGLSNRDALASTAFEGVNDQRQQLVDVMRQELNADLLGKVGTKEPASLA
jgi:hypothetical protein